MRLGVGACPLTGTTRLFLRSAYTRTEPTPGGRPGEAIGGVARGIGKETFGVINGGLGAWSNMWRAVLASCFIA